MEVVALTVEGICWCRSWRRRTGYGYGVGFMGWMSHGGLLKCKREPRKAPLEAAGLSPAKDDEDTCDKLDGCGRPFIAKLKGQAGRQGLLTAEAAPVY